MWRCLPLLIILTALAAAQAPQHPSVPAAAQASEHFDAKAATDAWLATLPPSFRARSDAYFEGTYWLILWDFLAAVAVSLVLLQSRLSARMRDLAERHHPVRIPSDRHLLGAIRALLCGAHISADGL